MSLNPWGVNSVTHSCWRKYVTHYETIHPKVARHVALLVFVSIISVFAGGTLRLLSASSNGLMILCSYSWIHGEYVTVAGSNPVADSFSGQEAPRVVIGHFRVVLNLPVYFQAETCLTGWTSCISLQLYKS